MTCKIDGCGRPAKTRGWCGAHYMRQRKSGVPAKQHRRPAGMGANELAAWILGRLVPDGECLDWPYAKDGKGYGLIQGARAHRLICAHFHGPAPAGKPFAIHSCDRPPCCNPAHLRWGSQQDNSDDMVRRGRSRGLAGIDHHSAKLTDDQVREIRALRAGGASGPALAARFGVSATAVYNVANGQTWRHV